MGSLEGTSIKTLMRSQGSAIYSSGNLLFARQNTLMAQAFDPETANAQRRTPAVARAGGELIFLEGQILHL